MPGARKRPTAVGESGSVAPEPPGRSALKRSAILDAATSAFLRNGYRGTSMDQIAAAAAVSKQTVYKHFADKERLFSEIVRATVDQAGTPVSNEVRRLADSGDVAADLRDLARRQLEMVMQPRILQLRRLVISEAARFPELGRKFHEQGAERTVAELAEVFAGLGRRGLLDVPDPALAARHFNWLIMSAPMNRAMMLGQDVTPPAADLRRWADEGVTAFLAAYAKGRPTVS